MDRDSVAQLAVVVLLLSLAVPALSTAHATAGTPFEYEETATVSYTSDYTVTENATDAEGYGADPTVTNASGATLVEGVDYEWAANSGTLSFTNTSNTTAGEDATIRYTAHQRTVETQTAWSILAPFMGLFGLFGFYSAVRVLLGIATDAFEGVSL